MVESPIAPLCHHHLRKNMRIPMEISSCQSWSQNSDSLPTSLLSPGLSTAQMLVNMGGRKSVTKREAICSLPQSDLLITGSKVNSLFLRVRGPGSQEGERSRRPRGSRPYTVWVSDGPICLSINASEMSDSAQAQQSPQRHPHSTPNKEENIKG